MQVDGIHEVFGHIHETLHLADLLTHVVGHGFEGHIVHVFLVGIAGQDGLCRAHSVVAGLDGLVLLFLDHDLVGQVLQHDLRIFVHFGQYPVQDFHAFVEIVEFQVGFLQATGLAGLEHHDRIATDLLGFVGHPQVVLDIALVLFDHLGQFIHLPFQIADLGIHLAQAVLQVINITFQDADGIDLYKNARDPAHDGFVHVPDEVTHLGVEDHVNDQRQDTQADSQVHRIPDDGGQDGDQKVCGGAENAHHEYAAHDAFGALPECFGLARL